MQFDKTTLEKGLENALVRAYLLRDFALPLKGYELLQLVGNQYTCFPLDIDQNEDFIRAVDPNHETMIFPVKGPVAGQNNLVTFHLDGDSPIHEITELASKESEKAYSVLADSLMEKIEKSCSELSEILEDGDIMAFQVPLVFSFAFSVKEICSTYTPVTNSLAENLDGKPLRTSVIKPFTPVGIQIGLSDYKTREDVPSLQILGILADPGIKLEEKKKMLLEKFDIDIDRSMYEDYEYLLDLKNKDRRDKKSSEPRK